METTVKMTLTTAYHRRADIEDFLTKEFLSDNNSRNAFLNTQRFQVWTKEEMKGDGYEKLAKIKYYRDDLQAELTGLDFVFILNEMVWESASNELRKAILSHFLHRIEPLMEYRDSETNVKFKCMAKDVPDDRDMHATFQVSKTGRIKFKIIKPFGEFPEVIKEFGEWNSDIREIKNSFQEKK